MYAFFPFLSFSSIQARASRSQEVRRDIQARLLRDPVLHRHGFPRHCLAGPLNQLLFLPQNVALSRLGSNLTAPAQYNEGQ